MQAGKRGEINRYVRRITDTRTFIPYYGQNSLMVTEARANSLTQPSRLALDYALDLLSDSAKKAILHLIETKYSVSIYNTKGEISRKRLENVMTVLFDSGASLFMQRFDEYLRKHTGNAVAS